MPSGKASTAPDPKRNRVALQAFVTAMGTLVTRVFGLLRETLLTAYFSRTVTDAWIVAFRIPNLFRRLFGEGSLAVSFVPVFVETIVQDPTGVRSRNLLNSFYTLFLLTLSVLTALGTLFPDQILAMVIDEKFNLVPGKLELTRQMFQVMFCYVFLVCTYAFFMGVLNALGKFGLAALSPVFWNFSMIASIFVPQKWLQWEGQALAWGVVVGGVIQAGILIPLLAKKGYFPKLSTTLFSADVNRVFKAMLPGLLGSGLLQVTTLINTRFASSLAEGPVSYIYIADRLLEFPLSLISVSLGVALLPTLSRLWAEKKNEEFNLLVGQNIRLNLYLGIAAGIGLFFLAEPIVRVLFERGKFAPEETLKTAAVVRIFSTLAITTSCARVLVPSFYAIKNTGFPALASLVCLLVHLVAAPAMMGLWQMEGLNAASALSSFLNILILTIGYRRYFGNPGFKAILTTSLKTLIAGVGMAVILTQWRMIASLVPEGFRPLHHFDVIVGMSTSMVLGTCIFFILSAVLRIEEFQFIYRGIRRRILAV